MKIGMVSLGCPKNLVDSEVMLGLAQKAGHQLTRDPESAEVLVVNTCAFIDKAKQESIDTILEMAEHKKTGACRKLIVTGCMAERYRAELQEQIPEIDAILGTGEVPGDHRRRSRSPSGCSERTGNPWPSGPEPGASEPGALPYVSLRRRHAAPPRHAPPLRLRQGGRRLRLQVRLLHHPDAARPLPQPRRTTRWCRKRARWPSAASRNCCSSRRTRRSTATTAASAARWRACCGALQQVDGIEWIRMLYLYPTTIGDDVLDAMAELDKVCRYVDLPLQHAADPVLKRMKRPGTRASYERLLDRIRTRVPGVTLRTTFIVGYPGETADDFEELMDFVGAVEFDHVGVFTYSHEEGTSAHQLADDVPAAVKDRRRAALMRRQRQIVTRAHRRRVGDRVRLLVDGPSSEHDLVLRARSRRPGARHRPGGLPDRLRPVGVLARRVRGRRAGLEPGIRPGGAAAE